MKGFIASVGALLASLIAVTSVRAAEDITELAATLAKLRGEVESLSNEIESHKDEAGSELRALGEQRIDIELQIGREKLRLEQSQGALERLREKVGDRTAIDKELKPVVERGMETLAAAIRGGIPFRTDERLSELGKLKKLVEAGTITHQEAGHRLWLFIEDELRLTRESGLYRQTVKIGNEDRLVDVARLGMVALYFETSDGRFGRAVRKGEGWEYEVFQDATDAELTRKLFEQFKKQIRVGFYEIPNALAAKGAGK